MPPTCKICGGTDFQGMLNVENANFSSRIDSFDILRCKICGLSIMDPFPTQADVEEIYVQNNTFSKVAENPCRKNILFPILEPVYRYFGDGRRFIVRNCVRLAPKGRRLTALDIGCSTGALIDAFRNMTDRVDCIGIDIDPKAKELAREDVRHSIFIGDLKQVKPSGPFDIITMEMLVEHLLDISLVVKQCSELLAPGGVLFFCTPDIDSAEAHQEGADWWLVNRPGLPLGHVIWFNCQSVEELARRHGFRIAYYRNRGNLLPHMPNWMRRTLESVLGHDPISNRFVRWYPFRILWALFVTGFLSETLSRGEYLYAFLVKEPAD